MLPQSLPNFLCKRLTGRWSVLTGLRRIAYPGENSAGLNRPADVVLPFLFLASAESKGITGRQLALTAPSAD